MLQREEVCSIFLYFTASFQRKQLQDATFPAQRMPLENRELLVKAESRLAVFSMKASAMLDKRNLLIRKIWKYLKGNVISRVIFS